MRVWGVFTGPKPDKKLTVAVGRDSRPSGQMVFSAVAAGLIASGINIIDLGICSTPGVGLWCVIWDAMAVIITASHNPIPWNGIKLLLDNGIALPRLMAEDIIGRYHQRAFRLADSLHCGKITCNGQTPRAYGKGDGGGQPRPYCGKTLQGRVGQCQWGGVAGVVCLKNSAVR